MFSQDTWKQNESIYQTMIEIPFNKALQAKLCDTKLTLQLYLLPFFILDLATNRHIADLKQVCHFLNHHN